MPFAAWSNGISCKLIPVDTAYSATSVNVAVFRANSVVSKDSMQYVAYYDPEGYLTIGRRVHGSDDWTIERQQYRGNVADAHNVISIMIDDNDILHASFDHHGHPLKYCRSVAPGSLTLGPLEPMTGVIEDDVTYPEFYKLPDGQLLFAYRSGASGRGNLVMNRYDTSTGKWSRLHDNLIDGENERNAYWQICTGPDGTIHLSWVWRETWMVETNHDLCYARSRDNGVTWERSDGTPYSLPITISTAEVACHIPQNSELINQTSMSTDNAGNPYIATYWREQGDSVPQYRLVWHDGTGWNNRQVSQRTEPFSLAGGGTKMIPIARPRVLIDNDKVYYITRDAERGSKVTIYHGDIDDPYLTPVDVTDFGVDAWEPSYDTELWKEHGKLHIYVQEASQGDGEKVTTATPKMVYILEVSPL
ncbi:MAG: BNR repeat-containing protein [Muribaculaceae bacterium]|nr:BNR repeat-containing protein [Muribaculaceae bacterium]